MQIGRGGILDPRIQLGDNAEQLFIASKGIDEGQRALAAYSQGEDGAWEQHRVPNRKDGKRFRYKILFISHSFRQIQRQDAPPCGLDAGAGKRVPNNASLSGRYP